MAGAGRPRSLPRAGRGGAEVAPCPGGSARPEAAGALRAGRRERRRRVSAGKPTRIAGRVFLDLWAHNRMSLICAGLMFGESCRHERNFRTADAPIAKAAVEKK
ncbi:elongin-C isoform X3 [Cygnus atratus]|uniref:elongin-C isoform X3 n=1 Tax=Cygnus atratus TaxID=8868 RepID=UPI0021B7B46F|nr:elongin-C isoform X3 [Cygnus atratus]